MSSTAPIRLPAAIVSAMSQPTVAPMETAWADLSESSRPDVATLTAYILEKGGQVTPPVAQWLVDQGVNPSLPKEREGYGYVDWMSMAIAANNKELVTWLAKDQQLANRRLPMAGPTPLIEAIQSEKWTTAQLLVDQGAEVNALNMHGQTALHQAAQGYKVQAMVWLVEHGANPSVEDKFNHLASELIPQDPGKEWRPDDVYNWLVTLEEAEGEAKSHIPQAVHDEALVEKFGLSFSQIPPEEWNDEQKQAAKVLAARGLIQIQNDDEMSSSPPRSPRMH